MSGDGWTFVLALGGFVAGLYSLAGWGWADGRRSRVRERQARMDRLERKLDHAIAAYRGGAAFTAAQEARVLETMAASIRIERKRILLGMVGVVGPKAMRQLLNETIRTYDAANEAAREALRTATYEPLPPISPGPPAGGARDE